MKSLFYLGLILLSTLVSINAEAQTKESPHIDALIKQIQEFPSQSLGYSGTKIYHIYEIVIPEGAEISENANSYIVNPIQVTLAVSNSAYDITKQKVNYRLTVFKEFKGTHAMGRKDVGSIETIWQKKESTREFQQELKALKNLTNTPFDELYGPEDDFPDEWKK